MARKMRVLRTGPVRHLETPSGGPAVRELQQRSANMGIFSFLLHVKTRSPGWQGSQAIPQAGNGGSRGKMRAGHAP